MAVPTTPGTRHPIRFEDRTQQQVHTTTCYMCACRCGIKVTTEQRDGETRLRFIQGNPKHLVNQGVLCAKGSAGIQKQYSRAKLRQPLIRRSGTERGDAVYDPISWEDALALLTERLRRIRATDPKQLAFFTGRDQMQALTSLWAQQFGTPNWAAHGGFCSVNMAAAGLYTIGYSFWEFGAPDWERAKYFVLWGVAEDHASNPIKIGLDKLRSRGAKFVSINPVRTGYSAIADEWVPIRPGSDGLLALAIVHELLANDWIDHAYLARYTNAPWLVIDAPGEADDGLFLRDASGQPLVHDQTSGCARPMQRGVAPALVFAGEANGRRVRSVFAHVLDRYLGADYAPEAVAARSGVPAAQIRRLAAEMAEVAFRQAITLPCRWTDIYGNTHETVTGRPVAFHAMRGISAHANGFQTCRALHLLQMLLGALDGPGNFRSKAPYPRPTPPAQLPENDPATIAAANTPLGKSPLGFPTQPSDLALDAGGRPLRIDHAYSWEAPLAAHGLMHAVIRNAVEADPYPIDTLILFMANMAWNSAMNTAETQAMLRAKRPDGEYAIPFLVVADAFDSETARFADLVLPDSTYFERFDAISLLDRPISEPDAIADAIRHPLLAPDRDVRPWQEVLIELASRLGFPAFVNPDGSRRFEDYQDFIVRYERAPGIGFLAGWRGADGRSALRGAPNARQWEAYIAADSHFAHHWPENQRWLRGVNRDYLEAATDAGFLPAPEPILGQLWCEPLQRFRLAGLGHGERTPTRAADRERLVRYFDPLPSWYDPQEVVDAQLRCNDASGTQSSDYPLTAITQRPMMMYHAWDSQNAWLRQILAENFLYVHPDTAHALGLADLDWIWVESAHGRIRCRMKTMAAQEPGTVWTWNAVGKMSEAWGLDPEASEATVGFLLNHLISESIRGTRDERRSNSDPITGQAAWYDLRVRLRRAERPGLWPKLTFGAPR